MCDFSAVHNNKKQENWEMRKTSYCGGSMAVASYDFIKTFRSRSVCLTQLRFVQAHIEREILKREDLIDLMDKDEVDRLRDLQWHWKDDRRPELLSHIFGIDTANGQDSDVAEEILFLEDLNKELDIKIAGHKAVRGAGGLQKFFNQITHILSNPWMRQDIINEHMIYAQAWVRVTALMNGFSSGRSFHNHYDFPRFLAAAIKPQDLKDFTKLMHLIDEMCIAAHGRPQQTARLGHISATLRLYGGDESILRTDNRRGGRLYMEFDIAGHVFLTEDKKLVAHAPRILEILSENPKKSEELALAQIDQLMGGDTWRDRINPLVAELIEKHSARLETVEKPVQKTVLLQAANLA